MRQKENYKNRLKQNPFMKKIFYLLTTSALLMAVLINCNKDLAVTGVKLDETFLTLGVGETKTLTATVLPEKATNKTVVFASSNPVVVTVLPNGLVTALSKGEATIVVTTADGGFTAICQIKVDDISVSEVKLNKNTLTLDIDETEELIATVLPENATNKAVYWTISNPAVATVINGMVYPLSLGNAIITVTTLDGNRTAKCDLEVIKRVSVTGITLNKSSFELGIGNSEKLIATISPDNASNKNVTWNSSNSSVASVDSEGLVTAIAAGTTFITVITEDGGFTATCEVKCENFTLPILITLEPIKIDVGYPYNAKLRGNITNVGEPPYTERGFIYTIGTDDPLDPNPNPMGPGTTTVKVTGNGIGIFEKEETLYFQCTIRAYAKTSMGISYGDMVTVSF